MAQTNAPGTFKGVRTQHPDYVRMLPKWKKCQDACDGETAVHLAGVKYLPKLGGELEPAYTSRLARTPFFNATWRTISGLRGMLFRKTAVVEVPGAVQPFLDSIDAAGTPLQTFVQEVVENALTVGRVGIMVDAPIAAPVPDGAPPLTVAQVQVLGLRPSLKIYEAVSIINWKTAQVGNASVLSLVVLNESAPMNGDNGEFGHDTEPRWRVLDLVNGVYRQRLFHLDQAGHDEQIGPDMFPMMHGAPMGFIPFVFVGVDDTGPVIDEPPLMDLVDMNFHHYMVSADYEHACHFSGLPTLFISGYQVSNDPASGLPSNTIYIGGPGANCLPDPQAKAYFVETSGDFTALRTNLEDKKGQMAVLGARMLEVQKAAREAAETVTQHRKGEESMLSGMAETISLGVTQALQWLCDWANTAGKAKYELNRDFNPLSMTAADIVAMLQAWQAGMPGYSSQEVFDKLQASEMIATGTTFEDEQARLANEGPRLADGGGSLPLGGAPAGQAAVAP